MEEHLIAERLSIWSLTPTQRAVLMFLRRVAHTRKKIAVYWEDDVRPEIEAVIERHIRQRELYRTGRITFDPDENPSLLVTEDGQLLFMQTISELRGLGYVWEKIVFDCEGAHVLYRPSS